MLKTIGLIATLGMAMMATAGCGTNWACQADDPDPSECPPTPTPDWSTPTPTASFVTTVTGADAWNGHAAAAMLVWSGAGEVWCDYAIVTSGGFTLDSGAPEVAPRQDYYVFWELDSSTTDAAYDTSAGDVVFTSFFTAPASPGPVNLDVSSSAPTPASDLPYFGYGPFCS